MVVQIQCPDDKVPLDIMAYSEQNYAVIMLHVIYAEMARYLTTAFGYIFRTADPPRLLHLYIDTPIRALQPRAMQQASILRARVR